MSYGIVKLNKDWYVLWSTAGDGPADWGMNRAEIEDYINEDANFRFNNGRETIDPIIKEAVNHEVELRLERLDKNGTTLHNRTDEDYIRFNRAGKNETCFNREQLIKWYCELKRDPEEEGTRIEDPDDE